MTTNNQSPYPIKQVEISADPPNISHEPRFNTTLISKEKITKSNYLFRLKKPKDFIFQPGQYIWLVLPELSKKHGTIDRRPYSIASDTKSETVDLLIRSSNSEFLSNVLSLKEGDEVEIIGPLGSAFIVPENGVILIANSIGIPQFLSALRSQATKNISMIICNSDGNLPYDKKELDELSEKYNYDIIYTKSKPESKEFKAIIGHNSKKSIYISGSQSFVNHITNILLELGIDKNQMSYEESYPQIELDKKVEMMTESFVDFKKDKEEELNSLNNLFLKAAKGASSQVILTDRNGHIVFANQASSKLTGYTFNEMRGQTPRLWGGLMSDDVYKELWENLKKGNAVKFTTTNRRRDGKLYNALISIIPIIYSDMVIAFIASEDDITKDKEADKAKTEFIPIISHQLRTLLSVISWYTEMLIDGDAGKLSSKQRKYLKSIYSGNQHMVELLNSLLNVSKIELGALAIEPEPTNVVDLTNNIVAEQKIDINQKKIIFSTRFEKNLPIIQADPKLLKMIIQNLLSNSIKYTPEGGEVEISFSLYNKRHILLKVSDTGFGIPKNQQSKIFTKLFRADNAKLKDAEGTGLGLYIVKSIVDKTGGKVWFESKENKGTTFYVLILIKSNSKK